jgi:3-phosphoshikimate 1-carboxyvinyltransferase
LHILSDYLFLPGNYHFKNSVILKFSVTKSNLSGEILIPGSKSHTIRALIVASLADGSSILRNPLASSDTVSCIHGIREMGATVEEGKDYKVKGFAGISNIGGDFIDVGNSGTSLRILTAVAALTDHSIRFDGDQSIRQRPMLPLLSALQNLGAKIESTNGKCPFTVKGPIKGGKTSVNGVSSQFLTALLFAAPLAPNDTEIFVENLNEKPYVEMTLDWLNKLGIQYEQKGLEWFKIKGGQKYKAFDRDIPADFSSATFSLCAAAITGSEILVKGLDFNDFQGDKAVFSHLEKMGVKLTHTQYGVIVKGGELNGIEIDLNATPDALPALAVAGCFAKGQTRLVNVPQARLKECDRINAIATELSKMGADITELPDGLIINQSKLTATEVHGYDDHRMVMALAIAAMGTDGHTIIDTAEAISVTYPSFVEDMRNLGAKIEKI